MLEKMHTKRLKDVGHVAVEEDKLDTKFFTKLSNRQSKVTREPINEQHNGSFNIVLVNMIRQIFQDFKKYLPIDVALLTL